MHTNYRIAQHTHLHLYFTLLQKKTKQAVLIYHKHGVFNNERLLLYSPIPKQKLRISQLTQYKKTVLYVFLNDRNRYAIDNAVYNISDVIFGSECGNSRKPTVVINQCSAAIACRYR